MRQRILENGPAVVVAALCAAAIGWWLGSVLMFFLNSPWARPKTLNLLVDFLLFGFMMLLLQVIPGIILYRRWRRELGEPDRA